MLFLNGSAYPTELERHHEPGLAFSDLVYPWPIRATRDEWQVLLESWERLQPDADRFATAFFDTLFACEPELRQLFGGESLEAQFIRFAHLLTELISAEDDPVELEHRIGTVSRRYGGDYLTDHDWAIRAAITTMLTEVSSAAMTPEMRLRWKSTYGMLVTIIRKTAGFSPQLRPTTLMRKSA
jgi:hemoglobin-like flavoprotein